MYVSYVVYFEEKSRKSFSCVGEKNLAGEFDILTRVEAQQFLYTDLVPTFKPVFTLVGGFPCSINVETYAQSSGVRYRLRSLVSYYSFYAHVWQKWRLSFRLLWQLYRYIPHRLTQFRHGFF